MIKGSVDSIESMGLDDGPGIRTVVFLTGCKLRCKYCHNPEMWVRGKDNYTPAELVKKIIRFKPYFKDNGGVTFSGGEPLMQPEFLLETCKLLKQEGIHIALDTAGVGLGDYRELLHYIDLIILDIKHVTRDGYLDLTGHPIDDSLSFIQQANSLEKTYWIRQVVVPGIQDNMEYMQMLAQFLKQIPNIERIDFLPYHKLGSEKYESLGINNPYKDMPAMDEKKCQELYREFMKLMGDKK